MADLSQLSTVQPSPSKYVPVVEEPQPPLTDSDIAARPQDRGPEGEGQGKVTEEGDGGRCVEGQEGAAVAMPDADDGDGAAEPQGRCSSIAVWLSSNATLIYASQFLSAWGDRMWTFAVALYLVEIENNSLRLTAIFGFALTISVLLFGALVGQWVDRTPRLKAASRSLFVQNISVVLNAVCLLLLLHYKADVQRVGEGALFLLCQMVIIFLGAVANLASVAEKICIQKDWVVVVAGDSRERLAEMNAIVRRIDLTVNILAPILVGQIMTFVSMTVAGIFIAAWNLVSLMLEYYLLLRVYKKVPRLAVKFSHKVEDDSPLTDTESLTDQSEVSSLQDEIDTRTEEEHSLENSESKPPAASPQKADDNRMESQATDATVEFSPGPVESSPGLGEPIELASDSVEVTSSDQPPAASGSCQPPSRFKSLRHIKGWFLSSYHGWLVYKSYPVYLAGLGMAFLYMTVMGFDSVTNGFGYSMGLSEVMLGVIRALGSVAGIAGTFAYPRLRQRIGTTRSGLYSLSEEILCLTLCVFSIWAPGSPFDPNYYSSGTSNLTTVQPTNPFSSITPTIAMPTSNFASPLPVFSAPSNPNATWSGQLRRFAVNGTVDAATPPVGVGSTTQTTPAGTPTEPVMSYASSILFFTGMVTSRIGLWMFDLVLSQLIQENVREGERGIFNGMQRSLECSMDMLHFILVIALPSPQTFGYLILLSFLFICCGAIFYCVFSFRDRGHLFHPEKLTICLKQNGTAPVRLREDNQAV